MVERGYIGIVPYSKRNDSTFSQELVRERCDIVIEEKASEFSKSMTIDTVIRTLKSGDKLFIASLIFLANDLSNLIRRVTDIENRGATLEILDFDNRLSTQLQAFKDFNAYVASSKIKAGQSSSTAKHGRKAKLTEHERSLVRTQWRSGRFKVTDLAKAWNVSRRTILRIVNIEE